MVYFTCVSCLLYSYLLQHPIGGRITVLQTSIPNIGPGALKYRDVTPSSTKIVSIDLSLFCQLWWGCLLFVCFFNSVKFVKCLVYFIVTV